MRKRPGVGNFGEQNWGISVSAVMLELAVMNNPIEVLDEAVILPELAAA